MANELTTSNKSSLAVLNKAKGLLNITNNILNIVCKLLVKENNKQEYTDIVEIIDNRYLLVGFGKYPGLSSGNKINLWD